MNLVVLYDTDEAELTGDVVAFLRALDLKVETVVKTSNRGKTLHVKEQDVLDKADVWVFILTPGSSRHGQEGFPSQSVCDEMGRAKERFKNQPERVIYLVDSKCNPQAVDQLAYISFDRDNPRTIIQALTQLVLELRELGGLKISETPQVPDVKTVAERTPANIKNALAHIAGLPNASISLADLNTYTLKAAGNQTEANILKQKLTRYGWIRHIPNTWAFVLSQWGCDVVEYERGKSPPSFLLPSALSPGSLSILEQILRKPSPPDKE